MVDVFTPEKRSEMMSRIRGGGTKPELVVRAMLHRMGYRFTVKGPKNRGLPGRPDLVLPRYPTVVSMSSITKKFRLQAPTLHRKLGNSKHRRKTQSSASRLLPMGRLTVRKSPSPFERALEVPDNRFLPPL
jgi:DNA mismatch endonuclease Vsr